MTPESLLASYTTGQLLFMLVVLLWETVWKAFALWKSARRNETYWFVAILIFNTVGILPILYIYLFSKIKDHSKKKDSKSKSEKKKVKTKQS